MERLPIYREFAERLMARGRAYRCYCTKEELEAQRAALKAKDPKAMFRYPGTCRDRKDQPDRPFVVRFRSPDSGRGRTAGLWRIRHRRGAHLSRFFARPDARTRR